MWQKRAARGKIEVQKTKLKRKEPMKKKTSQERAWKCIRNKKYLKQKVKAGASIQKAITLGTDRR